MQIARSGRAEQRRRCVGRCATDVRAGRRYLASAAASRAAAVTRSSAAVNAA